MPKACFQCRSRKVKCHRRSDSDASCANCERLDFTCSSAQEEDLDNVSFAPRDTHTLAGTARKRVSRACVACNSQKARCTAEKPSCKRCRSRGIVCEYTPSKRKIVGAAPCSPVSESSPLQTPSHDSGGSSLLHNALDAGQQRFASPDLLEEALYCDRDALKTHIDAYFDFVYPIPSFSFLHRALFMRDFGQDACPQALLSAVCAAGAIFISKTEKQRRRRDLWIDEAETFVLKRLDDPTLVNIQTLLLLTFPYGAMRNFRKVMTLLSIASRMAYLSRLNYECNGISFTLRETRRRVMWGLYLQDTMYSGGLPEFTTCAAGSNHVMLPCKEMDFAMDVEKPSEKLHPQQTSDDRPELGIMAHYIRLLDIRDRILRYIKKTLMNDHSDLQCQVQLENFSQELHNFDRELPKTADFNERALLLRAYSGTRKTLIVLHVWWHQCFLDLYQSLFPNLKESFTAAFMESLSPELVQSCRYICYGHAVAMVDAFKLITRLDCHDGLVVSDSCIAICAYQCVRVLRQGPSFQTEIEAQNSAFELLTRLKVCTDVLDPLRDIYSCVRIIQEDINFILHRYQLTTANQDSEYSASEEIAHDISQRAISKHGTFDNAYHDQMMHEAQELQVNGQTNGSAMIQMGPPQHNIVELPMPGQLPTPDTGDFSMYMENNAVNIPWIQDWNIPINGTTGETMLDPFFRIQEDFEAFRAGY